MVRGLSWNSIATRGAARRLGAVSPMATAFSFQVPTVSDFHLNACDASTFFFFSTIRPDSDFSPSLLIPANRLPGSKHLPKLALPGMAVPADSFQRLSRIT